MGSHRLLLEPTRVLNSREAEAPKTLVEWLLGLAARIRRTRPGVPH